MALHLSDREGSWQYKSVPYFHFHTLRERGMKLKKRGEGLLLRRDQRLQPVSSILTPATYNSAWLGHKSAAAGTARAPH